MLLFQHFFYAASANRLASLSFEVMAVTAISAIFAVRFFGCGYAAP
jgi:hypothetical protein